jgi:acetyl-CoA carboxylase biotin carboxyl carrier protein
MTMHIDQLQQLSAWLAATDVALLELRGPDEHLRLRHDGTRVEVVEDDAPPTQEGPSANAGRIVATAISVGVFLHHHPLQQTPLARSGTRVRAGQTLGLLQIGSLLLPVSVPQAAVVTGPLVEHGETVGYGTPLIELQPLVEAS